MTRSSTYWRLAAVAALVLAAGNLGMSCGPPSPTPDTCDMPGPVSDGAITSLEIGGVVDGRFVPYTDGAVAPLVIGGQGASMIVAHLRVRGSGLPTCLPQQTALEQLDGLVVSSENGAMATTPAGADGVETGDILLPYYGAPATPVRLRATVGDRTLAVVVWTDAVGVVDAGVDAPVDAGVDASPDAP